MPCRQQQDRPEDAEHSGLQERRRGHHRDRRLQIGSGDAARSAARMRRQRTPPDEQNARAQPQNHTARSTAYHRQDWTRPAASHNAVIGRNGWLICSIACETARRHGRRAAPFELAAERSTSSENGIRNFTDAASHSQ